MGNRVNNGNEFANQKKYPFILPDLPFDKNALKPHMSPSTFDFHHGKHHNAYVQNLNKLLTDSPIREMSLEEIMMQSSKDASMAPVFNNAAQIWNHTFFWHSLSPSGGGRPSGTLLDKIESDFGGFDAFIAAFKAAATSQFGSGWAWLILNNSTQKLEIVKTSNAHTPFTDGHKVILACDVWEHAYYLDYQNRRPDYVSVFLDHLVNWGFASDNLAAK